MTVDAQAMTPGEKGKIMISDMAADILKRILKADIEHYKIAQGASLIPGQVARYEGQIVQSKRILAKLRDVDNRSDF